TAWLTGFNDKSYPFFRHLHPLPRHPFTLLLAFLPHKKCQGCPVTMCQGCHETEHFSLPIRAQLGLFFLRASARQPRLAGTWILAWRSAPRASPMFNRLPLGLPGVGEGGGWGRR